MLTPRQIAQGILQGIRAAGGAATKRELLDLVLASTPIAKSFDDCVAIGRGYVERALASIHGEAIEKRFVSEASIKSGKWKAKEGGATKKGAKGATLYDAVPVKSGAKAESKASPGQAARDAKSEYREFYKTRGRDIQTFEDAERFSGTPDAGVAAMAAFASGAFTEINSNPNSDVAASMRDYVNRLPLAKVGALHRVVAFESDGDRRKFLASIGNPGSVFTQDRTFSSWTDDNPSGKSAMEHIGRDVASQFGGHEVFLELRNPASAKDVSFVYGDAVGGAEFLLSNGQRFKVDSIRSDGDAIKVLLSDAGNQPAAKPSKKAEKKPVAEPVAGNQSGNQKDAAKSPKPAAKPVESKKLAIGDAESLINAHSNGQVKLDRDTFSAAVAKLPSDALMTVHRNILERGAGSDAERRQQLIEHHFGKGAEAVKVPDMPAGEIATKLISRELTVNDLIDAPSRLVRAVATHLGATSGGPRASDAETRAYILGAIQGVNKQSNPPKVTVRKKTRKA